ncbi:MAG: hypothetical protein Q4E62_06450 [Sutterellaceae bacterium]|nr:hypothetical protein [Sutterellaceae bacterium]
MNVIIEKMFVLIKSLAALLSKTQKEMTMDQVLSTVIHSETYLKVMDERTGLYLLSSG